MLASLSAYNRTEVIQEAPHHFVAINMRQHLILYLLCQLLIV
jgi:hypothetical protein